MNRGALGLLLIGAIVAGGCSFENRTELLLPTAPGGINPDVSGSPASSGSGSPSGSSSGGSSSGGSGGSSSGSSSPFTGEWASPNLPGFPQMSSCTDLEWSISSQSTSAVTGVVSAVCGGIADITANVTGQMASSDRINLAAKGEIVALGLTCPFDLTGVGREESSDAWRLDYSGSTCLGPVSGSELLRRRTSPAPEPEPEPAPSPSPSPSPSPNPSPSSGPVPCAGNTGSKIVECVENAYPSRLAAGVSLATRTENMKFLRDRIIETAKCKGMDVGLNLKRGGPSISTDFVAWRHDGLTEGVDVGQGYDNTRERLNLIWHTYGPPTYGHPYYKDYGHVNCH